MDISYFHWSTNNGPSIVRSFRPMIDKLKETENVQEFRVPYNGSLPWNILRNIWFVYKHRNKNGINHITGDIHYCILGLLGCKSVLTIHDDYAMITACKGFFDKTYKWLLWLYLPIRLANRVICISETTKYKIDKWTKSHKTQVITHHSVDTEFKYTPKVFNNDSPIILQIGNNPQKNLETTIKAIAELKCKLRVVKKMTNEQHYLAQTLNIDYTNIFDLTDQEIIDEYKNADIVVFPSLFEGLGMPIIEGQAVGRVVITSNIPPMNEVAGKGAFLLQNPLDEKEYQSAIRTLINNTVCREKLIKEGLENAKRYSTKEAVQKYTNLYKEL